MSKAQEQNNRIRIENAWMWFNRGEEAERPFEKRALYQKAFSELNQVTDLGSKEAQDLANKIRKSYQNTIG